MILIRGKVDMVAPPLASTQYVSIRSVDDEIYTCNFDDFGLHFIFHGMMITGEWFDVELLRKNDGSFYIKHLYSLKGEEVG